MSAILITGGNGLLGKVLQVHFPGAHCPSQEELDISRHTIGRKYDLVIHCAAIKTTDCDRNPLEALKTNIIGTAKIAERCHKSKAKLVYISTDYVFRGDRGNYSPRDEVDPQNYYAETKLAGEYAVKSLPKEQYLIVRTSFYPDIFPYDQAFTDQYTSRLPVSQAAARIAQLVQNGAYGIHHIAGPRQSVFDFAVLTAGGRTIEPITLSDHSYKRPRDTSLLE